MEKSFVYSVDKIKIKFKYVRGDLVNSLARKLGDSPYCVNYVSSKMTSCKMNYVFQVDNETSIYLGLIPNWEKEDKDLKSIVLEFNPNKVDIFMFEDMQFLKKLYRYQMDIMSVDIACDMFVPFESVRMLKRDRREYYCTIGHGVPETYYLGKKDTCKTGAIKLYNKGLERKQDIDWTRFEITVKKIGLAPTLDHFKTICKIPTVFKIDKQLNIEYQKLDDITRIVLDSCIDDINKLYSINNYRTRKRYEQLLHCFVDALPVNVEDIYKCYINYINVFSSNLLM